MNGEFRAILKTPWKAKVVNSCAGHVQRKERIFGEPKVHRGSQGTNSWKERWQVDLSSGTFAETHQVQ